MSRIMFYFDSSCIETAHKKVIEIFLNEGLSGLQMTVFTSYGSYDSNIEGKDFISYDIEKELSGAQPKIVCEKVEKHVNDIIRNFDWESIGVTGFEEVKLLNSEETAVEVKSFGLRKVDISEISDIERNHMGIVVDKTLPKEYIENLKYI